MALHAQTWKLARHRRIPTRRSDEPIPEPTHSRQADSGKRSRRLGAPSKQALRQVRLAIHNRKRPGQAQEAISPIRMTRATRTAEAGAASFAVRRGPPSRANPAEA